ncbi:MAG TPA: exonuclease SbcCD subunit D [Clostridiales bacterium]|nr:exonuclease SbcCD subunit D [Clostridiales bacterium]
MDKSVRVIHTGDLHIGVQNYGRLESDTGIHTRLRDFLNTFDYLVEYAIDNDVDAVLICGDIFKNREPNTTQQREFAKRIKKLSDTGINVYIIVGNHDVHNAPHKATSVEIYDVVDLPNVHVRRKPSIDILDTKHGPIQVIALPYVSPSVINAEGTTIEELSLDMRKKLCDIVDNLAKKAYTDLPTVLMSHYSVIGAVPGSERSIMLGREITLPLSCFARDEFDYVALGHIHKHQVMGEEPPVVYCGSIDRVDFNEEEDKKGFVIVELGRGYADYEFVELPTRPFKTIYVDTTEGDPFQLVEDAITPLQLEDAIVKLKVKINSNQLPDLREGDVYRLLRDKAFYVAGIEKDIISDKSHLRHPGITERMDIEEAVTEYIDKKEEYEAIKDDLLRLNSKLLARLREEDIV